MAQLDLNLIPTFLLLYETRSATRTAEELSLTQPAVSHALGRLRRHFNDRLFNRSPGGLQPTELATTIYPTLRQAIEVIDTTVRGAGRFDPTTSRRTFRLHATDLGEINLLPAVLRLIADTAPHIDLHVEPLNFSVVEDRLRQGRADAAICTPPITAPDVDRDLIRRDSYCGICSADHPRIGNEPTLDDFLAERHIAVEVTTGHTDVDHALASLGHVRDVALRISHFAAPPDRADALSVDHPALGRRPVPRHRAGENLRVAVRCSCRGNLALHLQAGPAGPGHRMVPARRTHRPEHRYRHRVTFFLTRAFVGGGLGCVENGAATCAFSMIVRVAHAPGVSTNGTLTPRDSL